MIKSGFILFAILGLTACSAHYSSNGEDLYRKSVHGAKIQPPPPLTSDTMSSAYDLPERSQHAKVSIAPPVEIINS